MSAIEDFLKQHKIEEVECLVPDMAGIARGKILPADRFIKGIRSNVLRIPEQIFVQTVTGRLSRRGQRHRSGLQGRLPDSGSHHGPDRALVR